MSKKPEVKRPTNDSKRVILNEGDLKKSFHPVVKPTTVDTAPPVNPKTIPKK